MRWTDTTFGMRSIIALLLIAMLASGCATTGPAEVCAGWKPIRLDAQSVEGITDRDAEAILAHNEFGQRVRCW